MVRISVLYPNEPGRRFDLDYYVRTHMALVHARWDALGLRRIEVDRGLAGAAPGAPAPFVCIGHLYFDSLEAFQDAMAKHGRELVADVPNFTDLTPQFQISEILPA